MANHCKVFTPNEYVIELLDAIKYKKNLYGRRVLENSCGDGCILTEIVRRYIESCLKENILIDDIRDGLARDIYGIELERETAKICRENLAKVADQYGIENVEWNIIQANYLLLDLQTEFSYVIGNPPYIVYRDIDKEERNQLKEQFAVCSEGKFDYYYAFLEKGVKELDATGRLAYIIPSSIYKNVHANNLRIFLKENISELYDYTYETKFPGFTTSSTILVFDNSKKSRKLIYRDVMEGVIRKIPKKLLLGKWNFMVEERAIETGNHRFGDYFKVSNTIATLCNDAFLLEDIAAEDDQYYYNKGKKIEKEIVKPAISRKRGEKKNIKIIFPYSFVGGNLNKYEENDFVNQFPNAAEYIRAFAKILEERNADKNAKWFEYGRSQAIAHMNRRKLVIPSILTVNIQAIIVDEEVIPCAGVYVTEKREQTLEQAKAILESDGFLNYLEGIGIFTTGRSRRVSVHDIEDYVFAEWINTP